MAKERRLEQLVNARTNIFERLNSSREQLAALQQLVDKQEALAQSADHDVADMEDQIAEARATIEEEGAVLPVPHLVAPARQR